MHENEFPLKPYIPPHAVQGFKGSRFDVYSIKRGTTSRDVIDHPGAVVILPLLDVDRVVLIKNERFSVGETLWELPAGTLEKDEAPEETAKRELKEETGYACSHLEFLTFFYTTPGFCNERMFAYFATELALGSQQLDKTEKISVEVFRWDRIYQMIKTGEIRDGKTIATLLYYRTIHHGQL